VEKKCHEFECYVATAWKRVDHGLSVETRQIGQKRFPKRPTVYDRFAFNKEYDADYITIEKRYEYAELPFA